MPNNKVLTAGERNAIERAISEVELCCQFSLANELRALLAAHPGQPGIACAGGHGITGLGRMTNDDDGFVRLQFVTEAAAEEFMEAYGPTVDVSQMPEPRDEVTDERIARLREAIEGECDGLAVDYHHARAILEYVDGDAAGTGAAS
ncbi:hypothetical protein [Burkholderia multivorans]|uniref:hypothetical protein n=1 Tax=Burkholderia multivorans TaxID=87883 RepID=UPI0021C1A732|nr:hypothetical protein [Burkholderia multivorans]